MVYRNFDATCYLYAGIMLCVPVKSFYLYYDDNTATNNQWRSQQQDLIIVNWIISNCFRVGFEMKNSRWFLTEEDRPGKTRSCLFRQSTTKILSFLFLFDLLSPHHTSHTTVCSEVKHKKVKSEQNKKEVMAMKSEYRSPVWTQVSAHLQYKLLVQVKQSMVPTVLL